MAKLSFKNKISSLANSSRGTKLFKSSLVLLIVVSVGVGSYLLAKQNFGDAASSKYNYYSKGIGHQTGEPKLDIKGNKVWSAPGNGAFAWFGPYVSLKPATQYWACFLLADGGGDPSRPQAAAIVDVVNKGGQEVVRVEKLAIGGPREKGTYDRHCYAFVTRKNIPKKNNAANDNGYELRVRAVKGNLLIKQSWIIESGKKNSAMSRYPDNTSFLFNQNY